MNDKTRFHDGGSIWERLDGLRLNLAVHIANYRLYRSTQAELAMLSDRDLSDIGIPRGMIADVAADATSKSQY